MPKWLRILLGFVTVILLGGVYLYFFGVQTMSAALVRYKFHDMPEAREVPTALSDLSISNTPHQTISYFGYELELPWDDVDEGKCKTSGTIRVTAFHSGNAFWFSTFPPKVFVDEIMKMSNLDPRGFRQIYGDDAFESDYGFHRKMLEATPSQITPFVSRKAAISGQMLLLFKTISMPKADSGIFSIETQDFKGFQFENPQAHPFKVTDELYSSEGGIDLMFIQKIDGSAPAITQPEINRVIQSIRKVPQTSAAPGGLQKSTSR